MFTGGLNMKSCISGLLTAAVFILSLTLNANAQFMTDDLLILKAGYIPYGVTSFDKGVKEGGVKSPETKVNDIKSIGLNYAVQAEYNLIFGIFWLGLGIEYQRVSADKFAIEDAKFKKFNNDFLMPVISFKFDVFRGLYTGISISGKYLISTETPMLKGSDDDPSQARFDKKMDLWANYIIGYNLPVAKSISIIFEGRFGYNVTNTQYKKMTIEYPDGTELGKYELTPNLAYDSAVYVGVGIRPTGMGY